MTCYSPTTEIDQKNIVDIAMQDVGVKEGSKRADSMMQRCGYRSSRDPWCAAAVSSWISQMGYDVKIVSVSQMKSMFKSARKVPPAPGAIVFFKHSHVGIVKSVEKDHIETIEGNVNDRVMIAERPYSSVLYCVSLQNVLNQGIEKIH